VFHYVIATLEAKVQEILTTINMYVILIHSV